MYSFFTLPAHEQQTEELQHALLQSFTASPTLLFRKGVENKEMCKLRMKHAMHLLQVHVM